jgi:GNAT superfamily N-acetyltransferase
MMRIEPIESLEPLGELKRQYVHRATAALDGMWLCGFVPMATHYGFYDGDTLSGFCCVNEDGYLLQFFGSDSNHAPGTALLESILGGSSPVGAVSGAFASTAEPEWLSRCLDQLPRFKVHALMYQLSPSSTASPVPQALELAAMDSTHLAEAVAFAVASIGAPAEWLTGYFGNLINRNELFGLWRDGQLVATGECRGYDEYQTGYADLGVIVAESERGQGLATSVLKQLVTVSAGRGLKPICSTEATNLGAQKAISRAGFFAGNRIIRFDA